MANRRDSEIAPEPVKTAPAHLHSYSRVKFAIEGLSCVLESRRRIQCLKCSLTMRRSGHKWVSCVRSSYIIAFPWIINVGKMYVVEHDSPSITSQVVVSPPFSLYPLCLRFSDGNSCSYPGYLPPSSRQGIMSDAHYSTYTGPVHWVTCQPNLAVPEHDLGADWVTFFGI